MDRTPVEVLGLPVHAVDCGTAAASIVGWAEQSESRVVCAVNVHMVMEAWDDSGLSHMLKGSDLSVPDGAPIVWALRALGRKAQHVRGTDLTLAVCGRAQEAGIPIGLFGTTPEALGGMTSTLSRDYPALQVSYAVSPPFRPLTDEEDDAIVQAIQESEARILLVGLGCPKQERWMMDHRGRVNCVMIGVGAAFEFLANTIPQAPRWMQRLGLEWVFRLAAEPRRLWRRYLRHNPRFVALFGRQWLRHRLARERR